MALSGLSACSSIYNDSFDCKAGTGVPCKSISEINTMVDRGEVGRISSASKSESPEIDVSTLPSFQEGMASANPMIKGVYRVPEQTLRVWLPAHLEEGGTWSGARYLYTVVTPGRWVESGKDASSQRNSPSAPSSPTLLNRSKS